MTGIRQFIEDYSENNYELSVINTTRPEPMNSMMYRTFDQSLDINEIDEHEEQDVVLLYDKNRDEIVAQSELADIEKSILLVNSDLYSTGTVSLEELQIPEVISSLTNARFDAKGFPESVKEKLPLIIVSRFIEKVAYNTDGGTLRSSFQKTSRINDERGTRRAYDKISNTDTDVHIYGVPNWVPDYSDLDVVLHGGYDDEFQKAWFVVYHGEAIDNKWALTAYQNKPGDWMSVWTSDNDKVRSIAEYIKSNL